MNNFSTYIQEKINKTKCPKCGNELIISKDYKQVELSLYKQKLLSKKYIQQYGRLLKDK